MHIIRQLTNRKNLRVIVINISIVMLISCKKNSEPINILKTNTPSIGIIEGDYDAGIVWEIDPTLKPDIFSLHSFEKIKKITFYSDIDTISFLAKPNRYYDFKIIHKKDTALTRIDATFKNEASLELPLTYKNLKRPNSKTDTIPFVIDKKRSGIILKVSFNNSEPLKFMFDTAANANVIVKEVADNKIHLMTDGNTINQSGTTEHTVSTSSNNIMEIVDLIWPKVKLLHIDYKNRRFEGILGWITFEDKIIEFDYDNNFMIIHNHIGTIPKGYNKVETRLYENIFSIKININIGSKKQEAWASLDTGFDSYLFFNKEYAESTNLSEQLIKTGESQTSGSDGKSNTATNYVVPKIDIAGQVIQHVPIIVRNQKQDKVEIHNLIGNKLLLENFNFVLDTKNNQVYIKPRG